MILMILIEDPELIMPNYDSCVLYPVGQYPDENSGLKLSGNHDDCQPIIKIPPRPNLQQTNARAFHRKTGGREDKLIMMMMFRIIYLIKTNINWILDIVTSF